jgi:hypothetical protein
MMCEPRNYESQHGENTQGGAQAGGLGKPTHERWAHEEATITRGGHCRYPVSGTLARAAACRSENEWRYRCHAKTDQSESDHGEANMLYPQSQRECECSHDVGITQQPHGTPLNHQPIAGKAHARHRQRKCGVP